MRRPISTIAAVLLLLTFELMVFRFCRSYRIYDDATIGLGRSYVDVTHTAHGKCLVRELAARLWALRLFLAVVPVWRLPAWSRRRQRRVMGLCLSCG